MKKKLLRLISFITAVVLIVSAAPFYAFAQSVSFEQIVNASISIIVYNEGNYTTVIKNDNGALSLGKICWHGTNALNLLKKIVALNPSQALNILGSSFYNEIITSSSWDTRIASGSEAYALAILLSTAESRQIQDDSAYEFVSGYVKHGQALGITEPEALVFFADYENQNGRTGAANFHRRVINSYGKANLGTLYEASGKSARRTRTYNFCATVNWANYNGSSSANDTEAPEISNVTVGDITEAGFKVTCDVSDNIAVSEVYFAVHHQDDGLDGVNWYIQNPSSSEVSHTVKISDFSSRQGNYCVYIYVFDEAGNYAYVVLNPVNVQQSQAPVPEFAITVSSSGGIYRNDEIVWNASASGGSGHYLYQFSLFKDGVKIAERKYSDYASFRYTAEETGVYTVQVSVYDSNSGETVSCTSSDVNIYEPIIIDSFTSGSDGLFSGQTVTWNLSAYGGEGDLQYAYTVYKNNEAVYSTSGYSSSSSFTYKTTDSGIYYAVVNIMDSRSQVVSCKSDEVRVIHPLSAADVTFSTDYAVSDMSVTCSVDVIGGTGEYTCAFNIYWNGIILHSTEELSTNEFTFTIKECGTYTAEVTITDADSTVITVSGGNLTADEKAKRGDSNCDGKVTASDARFALRCASKLDTVQSELEYAVDINSDGRITASDARTILRIASRLEK